MKKAFTWIVILLSYGLQAQEDVVIPGIAATLGQAQESILVLAEAFDDKQMDWRPERGTRSVGETILHTAAANYYIALKMGYPPPHGVDIMTMEKIKGKEAIIDTFKKSSEFVQEKIQMVEAENFAEEVDLGFGQYSRLSSLLIILGHTAEHKGQLIVYARSNGMVPPWNREAAAE